VSGTFNKPVVLIGLPGSGKSSVGRRLAQKLGFPFVDTDAAIEQRIGISIRDYFERNGESAFRDLEQVVLQELVTSTRTVLATGGGAVLRDVNRDVLRRNGYVIYLRSSPEDLLTRVRHDTKRPLLQVADPLARLRDLHALRDPLYRETAHAVIDTGRPSVAGLVHTIVLRLAAEGLVPSSPS
jgi:shikimate kinase